MELRPLILGWLLEGPCHGYALLQRLVPFEPGSAGLNEGRLYKLLGELERDGLTRHQLVRQKGLPDRKVLRLTRTGKAAFLDWLQEPSAWEEPAKYDFFLRDPFLVRLFFAHHLGRAGERELIRRHIQEVESRIREFTRLREGAEAFPAAPRRLEILVLGLEYLVAKLRWLRRRLAQAQSSPPKRGRSRLTGRLVARES
jgi:DNA-binding PadR family transcriptional regulator